MASSSSSSLAVTGGAFGAIFMLAVALLVGGVLALIAAGRVKDDSLRRTVLGARLPHDAQSRGLK